MFLAAFADGEFNEEERKHFVGSVESLTDRRLAKDALEAMTAKMQRSLESDGRDKRLAAVNGRLDDAHSKKIAFALAIQVVAADGIVRTSERELLFDLAEGLGLDRGDAADMVKQIAG